MRQKDVTAATRQLLQRRSGAMKDLTHINAQGEAVMVDISAKPATARLARAQGRRDGLKRCRCACRDRQKKATSSPPRA